MTPAKIKVPIAERRATIFRNVAIEAVITTRVNRGFVLTHHAGQSGHIVSITGAIPKQAPTLGTEVRRNGNTVQKSHWLSF